MKLKRKRLTLHHATVGEEVDLESSISR